MLTTTPFSQLPAKYQRYRTLLQQFAQVRVHYVGAKQVVMCDQLSRQAKWYKAESSQLLQVAAVLGYSAQEIELAAAGILGDDPQALRAPPGQDHEPDETELGRLRAAQAACEECKKSLPSAAGRSGSETLEPGRTHLFVGDNDDEYPGVLQRRTMDGTTELRQIYCPTQMREQAIKEVHNQAHTGVKGTYKNLRRTWYWQNMEKDVLAYVQRCTDCLFNKTRARRVHPGQFRSRQVSELFEAFSADVLELTIPSNGYKHILVIQDMFSTFILLIPIRRQTAEEITTAIIERVVSIFGPAARLVSDQGPAFTANLTQRVLEALQTQQTLLFSHTARSNGQNERSHATIMASLRIMTAAYKEHWSQVLPYIQYVYNTTPRSGSSLSAYDVVFGRQPRMPRSALLPPRTGATTDAPEDLAELDISKIATSLREAWAALRRKNLEDNEAPRKPVPVAFEVGEKVMVLYPPDAKRRSKHYMPGEGPFIVKEKQNNDYIIEKSSGQQRKVHWSVLHRILERSKNDGAGRGTSAGNTRSKATAVEATSTSTEPGALAPRTEPGARPVGPRPTASQRRAQALEELNSNASLGRIPFGAGSEPEEDRDGEERMQDLLPQRIRNPLQEARDAKPGLTLPLEEDDFVIVDRGADHPGELSIGRVRQVEDSYIKVLWYGCKDSGLPTAEQIWQPLYQMSDGGLKPSELPPRGGKLEVYETDRERVLYKFPELDGGRLPSEAQNFLASI